jgi:ADP-heptose:LPS heptosyltransferase
VQELRKFLPPHRVEDLTGSLTLTESIAVLRQAWGVIGVDTGLIHIAATWGSPTLVLTRGGHWGRFFPYPASFPYPPCLLSCIGPCRAMGVGGFANTPFLKKPPIPASQP